MGGSETGESDRASGVLACEILLATLDKIFALQASDARQYRLELAAHTCRLAVLSFEDLRASGELPTERLERLRREIDKRLAEYELRSGRALDVRRLA